MQEVLFFIAAYFAEVIGTIAGFGASTLFLPIALFFLDFKTALILVAILHMSGNIGKLFFFREGFEKKCFDKKLIMAFGIPSIILTAIGSLLVPYLPASILKFILGVFLIYFSLTYFINHKFTLPHNKKNSFIGGSTSGFFAGLIGTGGALRSAFLMSFNIPKTTYVATATLISFAVDLTRIPIYIKSGFLTSQFYFYIPILFTISIFGVLTGKKIIEKTPQQKFRKFVLIAIFLASLKFIYEGTKTFL